MELTFQKSADRWIAEFEAHADFNLHLEGVLGGAVSIFQRGTASGGYAYVNDATLSPSYSNVYDYDFTSLVYPKFIKVSCASEPTFAEVVSNGEVTELKFQEKVVEVTSNGTTAIAPDAGFAALSNVQLKVNVPTSGEGGGSGDTMRYINVTNGYNTNLLMYATLIAAEFENGDSGIIPPAMTSTPIYSMKVAKGLAFCWNAKMMVQGQTITIGESMEAFFEQTDFQPEYITEEEFYNLNA